MTLCTHDEARVWLAERLDWPLDAERAEALEAHLAACADCRAVDQGYRDDRAALRALPAPRPPRDLWARTSAALDREARRRAPLAAPLDPGRRASPAAAREREPGNREPRPRPSPAAASRAAPALGARGRPPFRLGSVIASLTVIAIMAVVGSQLLPGGLLGSRPVATPIALAPQPLAYIGVQGNEVVLVRSRLDRVCPLQTIDCTELPVDISEIVALPPQLDLSALAVDPRGEQAAVAGQAGNQTTFYILSLPPLPEPTPALSTATAGASALPEESAPSGAAASAAASGTPATPAASPTGTPRHVSSPLLRSPSPTPARTSAPRAGSSRAPAGERASATPTPRRSTAGAAASPAGATIPAVSGSRASGIPGSSATPGGVATGVPSALPGSTPEATVAQAILTGVVPTGLPAAWAPDGSALAFSAMPADGSHGSDIYMWQPGDTLAVPVTSDHNSFFASWAGDQIVGSSVEADPGHPSRALARSFVIDPLTGERRPLRLSNAWLPSVDPTGRFVAYWHGNLLLAGGLLAPGRGELDFNWWAALDPFVAGAGASTAGAAASNAPSPIAGATAIPTSTRSARATKRPTAEHTTVVVRSSPAAGGAPHERILETASPSPSAVPSAGPQPIFPPATASIPPTGAGGEPAAEPGGSGATGGSGEVLPGATFSPASAALVPPSSQPDNAPAGSASAEGSGAGSAAPSAVPGESALASAAPTGPPGSVVIGDYAIGWASDGSALGVWRAGTPGALAGELSVFSIDPVTGLLQTDPPFLGPTPAQRYFSMGRDRIAWTTPPDFFGTSQLHVVAWGAFGRGELRRSVNQQRLLTAF